MKIINNVVISSNNSTESTSVVYLNLANNTSSFEMFAFCPSLVRVTIGENEMGVPAGTTMFVPGASFLAQIQQAPDIFDLNSVKALMFPNVKIMGLSQELKTCREFVGVDNFDSLPRIAEEEFYSLTAPTE